MVAAVIADVWKTTPFVAIILLGGLQAIPLELYEAQRLDGAAAWQQFRHLTLPMLWPFMAVALLFRLVQTLGIFDLIWVLTGGGPAGTTQTVAIYLYDTVFRHIDLSYGAALTLGLIVGIFVIALPLLWLARVQRKD
jgi:multiple sugar transport system permease protein